MAAAQPITVTNPATGAVLAQLTPFTEAQAQDAIVRARRAQKAWGALPLEERIKRLWRFSEVLEARKEEVSELIARESGKVLQEALTLETLPVIDLTRYFCRNAPRILEKKWISMHLLKHRKSYIHYKPRGVVFVISPWNFPFTIATGTIVTALLAGNAVVHKPASLTPLIALKTRELFDEAGLDADLLIVTPTGGATAEKMIGMGVNYVNFTGSTAVGKRVAELCGKHLIPCSMELGGKDPAIVCADADLDFTINNITWGAFCNAGQVCASVERAYVHRDVYDAFVTRLVERVKTLTIGDPLKDGTQMGAMRDPKQIGVVHEQVEEARRRGGHVLTGGFIPEGPGQFYPPTVVTDVDDDFEIVREESFGPVLPVMKVDSEEEAVARANKNRYGLTAVVYTRDVEKGTRIAEQLEAGTVMINEAVFTHGAPNTPWGGVKESGIGRVHGDDSLIDLSETYHVNLPILPQLANNPLWHPYSLDKVKRFMGATQALFGKGISGKIAGAWQAVFPK